MTSGSVFLRISQQLLHAATENFKSLNCLKLMENKKFFFKMFSLVILHY